MAGKIFVNYRRGDDPGFTHALRERLESDLPAYELFMDADLKAGHDFVAALTSAVAGCDVLLAVIGPRWLELLTARASDPKDFVVFEIKTALDQDKHVIPVLVAGAAMPRAETLPEPIRGLAYRHAVRLTPERFRADCQGLVTELKEYFKTIEAVRAARIDAMRVSAQAERQRREEEAARIEAARATAWADERRREAEKAAPIEAERRRREAEARQGARRGATSHTPSMDLQTHKVSHAGAWSDGNAQMAAVVLAALLATIFSVLPNLEPATFGVVAPHGTPLVFGVLFAVFWLYLVVRGYPLSHGEVASASAHDLDNLVAASPAVVALFGMFLSVVGFWPLSAFNIVIAVVTLLVAAYDLWMLGGVAAKIARLIDEFKT